MHVNCLTAPSVFLFCLPCCSVKNVPQHSHYNKGHRCWTLIHIFLAGVLGNRLILFSPCCTVHVCFYERAHPILCCGVNQGYKMCAVVWINDKQERPQWWRKKKIYFSWQCTPCIPVGFIGFWEIFTKCIDTKNVMWCNHQNLLTIWIWEYINLNHLCQNV